MLKKDQAFQRLMHVEVHVNPFLFGFPVLALREGSSDTVPWLDAWTHQC